MDELLKFEIFDGEKKIECNVISIIPNVEDESSPYIVYTDFNTEKGYKFLVGQLILENDFYTINKVEDKSILDMIKDRLNDEIISFAFENKEFVLDE